MAEERERDLEEGVWVLLGGLAESWIFVLGVSGGGICKLKLFISDRATGAMAFSIKRCVFCVDVLQGHKPKKC